MQNGFGCTCTSSNAFLNDWNTKNIKKLLRLIIVILQDGLTQELWTFNLHHKSPLSRRTTRLPVQHIVKTQHCDNYFLRYRAHVLCFMTAKNVPNPIVESADSLCPFPIHKTASQTKLSFNTLVKRRHPKIHSIIMTCFSDI